MRTVAGVTEGLRTLYPRLMRFDTGVVRGFTDDAVVDSPLGGRQRPSEFASDTGEWLERFIARSEVVHTMETADRVVHELELYLVVDGRERELPVMLVADVRDDLTSALRVYHSTWPVTGGHAVRPPLMDYALSTRPAEPVGTYHEALLEADAAKADSAFEPDGCVREPAGGSYEHCGAERTRWYRDILSQGPIVLHLGTIADDGETVVYEYMVDRWGSEPITPQAGAAAYQRGPSGRLTSARIYDDVEPPKSLRAW